MIPTGADGWVGETRHLAATLTLTCAGDLSDWLASAITVDEPLAGMPEGDVQELG